MSKLNTALFAKAVVWVFVLSAALLSAHDIAGLFERWGVPAPLSYLAVVFIDGVTWLGKMMRSHRLSRGTNKLGLWYLLSGASASLLANFIAGESVGMKALGILAVVAFMLGEIAIDKIEIRPTVEVKVARKLDPQVAAQRAAKARATRQANQLAKLTPAQRAAQTRKVNANATPSGLRGQSAFTVRTP